MAAAFIERSFYSNETIESVVTAVLTVICLKAFEYVFKTLVLSSGKEKLKVGNFALGIAIDQAQNPLNFVAWVRGTPDLPGLFSDKDSKEKRRIPLKRALLAVFIAVTLILADVVLFYGVMPQSRPLTAGQLTLGVNRTENPSTHQVRPNTCTPQNVETGRATLDGVFAFCNAETGSDFDRGVTFLQVLNKTEYSIGVYFDDFNGNTSSSVTTFSLLMPDGEGDGSRNLVAKLQGNTGEEAATAIGKYYKEKGCSTIGNLDEHFVSECTEHVKASDILELVLTYIEIVYDGPPGEVGTPNGEGIIYLSKDVRVGSIPGQKFTYYFMVIATVTLVIAALLVYLFVSDDSMAILAAMVRAKVGQNASVPAVAMEDDKITCADLQQQFRIEVP